MDDATARPVTLSGFVRPARIGRDPIDEKKGADKIRKHAVQRVAYGMGMSVDRDKDVHTKGDGE